MMNREICQKCWNQFDKYTLHLVWDHMNSNSWLCHKTHFEFTGETFNSKNNPPKECSYVLEHLVAAQDLC